MGKTWCPAAHMRWVLLLSRLAVKALWSSLSGCQETRGCPGTTLHQSNKSWPIATPWQLEEFRSKIYIYLCENIYCDHFFYSKRDEVQLNVEFQSGVFADLFKDQLILKRNLTWEVVRCSVVLKQFLQKAGFMDYVCGQKTENVFFFKRRLFTRIIHILLLSVSVHILLFWPNTLKQRNKQLVFVFASVISRWQL